MEISDNLLAAYVEGHVTDAERHTARCYLTEHPEELKCVTLMMDTDDDLDTEDFDADTATLQSKGSFSDICFSAAAFVPRSLSFAKKEGSPSKKVNTTFSQRLDSLLNDISD